MKNPVTALLIALSLTASPVMALNIDMNTLTPTLDFPEPSPEPVSQDVSGIDK